MSKKFTSAIAAKAAPTIGLFRIKWEVELYADDDGYCDLSKIARDLSFGFYRQP